MKKGLLLLAMALMGATATAQFAVWEDDFNDGEVSDWNLLDLDGNASNWIARKNIQVDENIMIIDGTIDILGSYNVDMVNGAALGTTENNWAISPAIDLSYYGGPITLVLNAQSAIYDGPNDLYVYASTSPAQESFTLVGTIPIIRVTMLEEEFKDYSVDLSQFSGQSEVYFALVTSENGFVGVEINTARIDAQSILSVEDPKGVVSRSFIRQNPVAENLFVQLGSTIEAGQPNLKIYNINGMLLKDAAYNEAGIPVSELSSGMYFAVVSDGNRTERLKFIKK